MAEKVYKNRIQEKYDKEVVPYLMQKFGYKSVMQCPRLVKIVINTGLGDIKDNAKSIQTTPICISIGFYNLPIFHF